nr:unnamed protein product [Digitaria exilis]
MRRHKWRVKVLSEFSPRNPRLLGLNVGAGVEVKLRLRRAGRDHDFIPYEEVLDTMLHELSHNDRGPHDAQFYKLWDELRKECEELVSKGITGTGQGFDGTGRRPLAPICEVCGTAKPKIAKAKYMTWSCKFCTLENSTKLDKCSACDQWRYSYGAP